MTEYRFRNTGGASPDPLHAGFLVLLPRVEAHARVAFRDLRCPVRREEALAEMVALCWLWFVRLRRRGEDPSAFPSALATFAARAVRSGRRLCGQERGKDALSPLARQRHSFAVSSLPQASTLDGNPLDEALHDNTQTPVPEQVSFRLDFPAWLATLSDRDRRLALDLMRGERTQDVAARYGLSPPRVSQLRRQFLDGWGRFCGDRAEVPPGPGS